MERINLAEPRLNANAKKYVLDCLDTNWISSNGKYIAAFEEAFGDFCEVPHVIATSNGTTALHAVLLGLDVGPGDEVLVPTLTYIASANAVRYCGATPVFVDAHPETLTIDPDDLADRVTDRTKGIMPVHLYGHPSDMDALNTFADQRGLWVLEDAAQAHGTRVGGRPVGGLGTAATFSFFGNKIVTTGEGGVVTTADGELAELVRLLRGQGMDPKRRYRFPIIGYNYRMTNIQAAIGLSQMERIDEAIAARNAVAEQYRSAVSSLAGAVTVRGSAEWATPVTWMFNVYLADGGEAERDAVMRSMDDAGVETRPVSTRSTLSLRTQPVNTSLFPPRSLRVGISLPTHEALTEADIQRVVAALERALSELDSAEAPV